jgi:ribosomal protein L7/L12
MQMTEAQLTQAIERIDKRLDWIEENLTRVVGLQYVPMGRSDTRPDASGVPQDVLELARAGKTMDAIKRYRDLTGLDFAHAREVIDAL